MIRKSKTSQKPRHKNGNTLVIAVQRAEHIDLQTKIETGQRNFRETCRGPEKDFYPKSQNAKVEDPQSSQSIKPELTSVHPYVAQISPNGSSKETR
ncbi:hypothetical protein F2Q69_00007362 [Brassica cretica]|uniref:Uncharacterized protein n=1 Tax=Brassica cretica TaxID=69181 RepID=A0A8S9PI35_BRACR|nr:hypothetical protein F2Q69_00007362 [Brassica cretica]